MTESRTPKSNSHIWRWALAFVLLLAAFLRLYRLDAIPPGFTHDEAGHGHDAVAILHGARPIYETVGYGREPLYDYLVAGLMAIFGATGGVLRFSPVPLGLLTLLATYAWVRMAFDRPTALAATALQAASFWSLATGRQALRSSLLPVLFTTAVCLYWRAVHGEIGGQARQGWQVAKPPWLVALFVGATLYTYLPARVLWAVFPLFLAYLALAHRATFRRVWPATLIAVLLGLLLATPLFAYLRAHPRVEQRLAMLDAPLQALKDGDVSVVLNRAWGSLAAFFVPGRGDDFLAYTIPGRPFFDLLTSALFLAGVGLCLARWRQPACAFSLMWFLVGISPSLITGAAASTTRSIAALPVAFLFPALAVVEGARWASARWGQWTGRVIELGLVGLVAVSGAISARDYFVQWGESPDVRAAYMHTLVETAGYLDAQPEGGVVVLSTPLPHAPHDPYVLVMSLRRRDLSLRWFDARRALVIPRVGPARLIVPSGVPLDAYLADLPGFYLCERVDLRADDLDPYFDIYDWEPQVTLAALRGRAQGDLPDGALPVNFGDALQFIGYNLRTLAVAPGGTVELATLWRVTDPELLRPRDLSDANEDMVLFTHALDATGTVVGQEDRLDAPAWDWQPGDVIVQLHRFALPLDIASGPVALEVGVYRRADLSRLPVLVEGGVVGDHVRLQSVEVLGE